MIIENSLNAWVVKAYEYQMEAGIERMKNLIEHGYKIKVTVTVYEDVALLTMNPVTIEKNQDRIYSNRSQFFLAR
jgi:hypothetical protein